MAEGVKLHNENLNKMIAICNIVIERLTMSNYTAVVSKSCNSFIILCLYLNHFLSFGCMQLMSPLTNWQLFTQTFNYIRWRNMLDRYQSRQTFHKLQFTQLIDYFLLLSKNANGLDNFWLTIIFSQWVEIFRFWFEIGRLEIIIDWIIKVEMKKEWKENNFQPIKIDQNVVWCL